jgi:hypothetical protein
MKKTLLILTLFLITDFSFSQRILLSENLNIQGYKIHNTHNVYYSFNYFYALSVGLNQSTQKGVSFKKLLDRKLSLNLVINEILIKIKAYICCNNFNPYAYLNENWWSMTCTLNNGMLDSRLIDRSCCVKYWQKYANYPSNTVPCLECR